MQRKTDLSKTITHTTLKNQGTSLDYENLKHRSIGPR